MRAYTEKEINIFSGVLSLAESGADLAKITSRQIAAAAGMGKATIYDYFSSKEEIITQAVIYSLSQQNEVFRHQLRQLDTFESKMQAVYRNVIDTVENSCSIFNLVTAIGGPEKIAAYFANAAGCSDLCDLMTQVQQNFADIIAFGRQTGAIRSDLTRDYVSMVLMGNLFTTGKSRKENRLSHRQIIGNAYTMLLKALN